MDDDQPPTPSREETMKDTMEETSATSDKSTPIESVDSLGSAGHETPEKNPADPPKVLPAEQSPPLRTWLANLVLRAQHKLLTSYYVQHLIVWVFLTLVLGAVFYGTGAGEISYIDSLYMTASAISPTSLSSIDLSNTTVGPPIAILVFMTHRWSRF